LTQQITTSAAETAGSRKGGQGKAEVHQIKAAAQPFDDAISRQAADGANSGGMTSTLKYISVV